MRWLSARDWKTIGRGKASSLWRSPAVKRIAAMFHMPKGAVIDGMLRRE